MHEQCKPCTELIANIDHLTIFSKCLIINERVQNKRKEEREIEWELSLVNTLILISKAINKPQNLKCMLISDLNY